MSETIEMFVDGRNFGKSYGTSFAVVLKSGKYVWQKSFDCGDITANEAALRAAEYALKSVKVQMRKSNVTLITNNKYVCAMLEKEDSGHWKKNAKANADVVARLRETVNNFPKLKILETSEDNLNTKVKDLSAMVAKEKKAVSVQG